MGKYLWALAVVVVVIGASIWTYQRRATLFRPDFSKVGGTRLICQADPSASPEQLDEAVSVLQRRFDAEGSLGIEVRRLEEGKIGIAIPLSRQHKERVEQIKRLIEIKGRFELGILARTVDDEKALQAAAEALKQPQAAQAVPPPSPKALNGSTRIQSSMPGNPEYEYCWGQLALIPQQALSIDEPSVRRDHPADLPVLMDALKTGMAFRNSAYPEMLFAIRQPDPKADPKTYVLVRLPDPDLAITADDVERTTSSNLYSSRSVLNVMLDREGSKKLASWTSTNLPRGDDWDTRRMIAVLIDRKIVGLSPLTSTLSSQLELQLSSLAGALPHDVGLLIRGGRLPIDLKLVQEEDVDPD